MQSATTQLPLAGRGRSLPSAAVAASRVDDDVDAVLPARRLVPLAFQHVLVMYAGAVAVPLVVGRALDLSPAQLGLLISADLIACGLATLIQTLGLPMVGTRSLRCCRSGVRRRSPRSPSSRAETIPRHAAGRRLPCVASYRRCGLR